MEEFRKRMIETFGSQADEMISFMANSMKNEMGEYFAKMAEEFARDPRTLGVPAGVALKAFAGAIRTVLVEENAADAQKGARA